MTRLGNMTGRIRKYRSPSGLFLDWNAIHFESVENEKVSGCKVNRAIPDAEQLTPKNDELNAKMQKAQPVKAGLFDTADVLAPRIGQIRAMDYYIFH